MRIIVYFEKIAIVGSIQSTECSPANGPTNYAAKRAISGTSTVATGNIRNVAGGRILSCTILVNRAQLPCLEYAGKVRISLHCFRLLCPT